MPRLELTPGTSFVFHPGLLPGGTYTHTTHTGRSLGYYLEVLIPLGPFGKSPLQVTLHGVTSSSVDLSVDLLRTVSLPTLTLFGVSETELQIKKRAAPPLGGGTVILKITPVRVLKTLQFTDPGRVRKIRGIAQSTRVSPQFANRMVESARSLLNRFIPDIHIYTDVYRGEEAGKSPGYGIALVAQSTTDALHSAEAVSAVPGRDTGGVTQTPEDIGLHAARLLLESVSQGGCIDRSQQSLVLLLMVLGKEDVGKVVLGDLSPNAVQFLRDLLTFFGVKFKITPFRAEEDEAEGESGKGAFGGKGGKGDEENAERKGTGPVVASCVGIGYSNVNKAMA